jgi:hypothetical protein
MRVTSLVRASFKGKRSRGNSTGQRPETVLEAVDGLINELDLTQKTQISKITEDVLIRLHTSLGLYIRNQFFYPENEKLMQSCRASAKDNELDVDRASSVIVSELWKILKKTHRLKVVK